MIAETVDTDLGLRWLDEGQHPLDWNGPANRAFATFRDEDLDQPIVAHLERVARRYPNRVAVTDSESSLSFAELWDGVSGLAQTIEAETKADDLVGIVLPACSAFPVATLACLAAGRPFVPIDPYYPSDWMHQVEDDARPALIIGAENVRREAGAGWRPAEFGLDQPACVVFTSGSTGRPKGIVNSQRALLQRVAQSINAAHINEEDRFLTLSSRGTIVGIRDTLTALLAGASIHLLDTRHAGAREILHAIRADAITILFAFPALLRSIIPYAGERAGGALRLVRVGGDTTLWSDIDLLRDWLGPEADIQSIYAATEAPMMQWFVDDSYRNGDPRVPIGYPLPGNRLALIGEDGCNALPGQAGELIVSGPYVTLGHWVDGHCRRAPSRLFRTGDLARQRPDGLLERLGRRDRQTKIRGTRVDLDGVEAVLRQHPLVRDAGALARTGVNGAVTLVAYVSARENAPAWMLDDVRELMRSAPPALRPALLYLASEIPRLPNSKLDVRSLQVLDEATIRNERAAAETGPGNRDRIGQTVAQVWEHVLPVPVRGPDDDFFEAGGDSLKAITFVMELERALGLELPLTIVTEAPQFSRLCEALRGHRAAGYTPLVPLKAGGGMQPVYFIHDIGGSVAGLFPMARRMTYSGAVIGIQARGLAGPEAPHASVRAMAAEYLRAIKTWQPEGPYHLCGYSFGGLVAFEMARQLAQSGDKMGLVGLFDTRLSPRRWPLHCWLTLMRRRMVQFASAARATPVQSWPAAIWNTVGEIPKSLRSYAMPAAAGGAPVPGFLKYARGRVLNVGLSAVIASARYRPGFYPGELTLVTARERDPGLPSLETIWSKHARALSVVETAGTHSTMLAAANADCAATTLTRLLSAS